MRRVRMRSVFTAAALLAVCLVASLPAHANVTQCTGAFESSLDHPDSAISTYSAPFGRVCVNLTSSTIANIEFTAANGYLFGDGSSAGVNVNASAFTAGSLSESLG